ncbi:MAG: hypothetical protein IJ867_00940 [Clostridia bacterium]|nr:hypothetical protein [Clostridia bacterium]
MINLTAAKCPNCGADIEVNATLDTTVCQYCGCTILVEGALDIVRRKVFARDDIDEKCVEISQKLNEILKLYIGNKNEMLLMLKERIGLVNSGKTTAKIAMMQTAHTYEEKEFDEPFTYRIGERTLNHFEYKKDGVIELTYESDEDGFFALEYYGKVTRYMDLDELSRVLDEITEEVRVKFK